MSESRRRLALLMIDDIRRRRWSTGPRSTLRRRLREHGGGSASVPASSAYLLYDSFTRADGPIGAAEIGGSWTDSTGNWIVSSSVAKVSGGSGIQTATIDVTEADGTFEVTYSAAGNFGICIRRAVGSASFIWTRLGGGLLRLTRTTAGVDTNIGTGAALVAGDVVKVVVSGDSFTVYLNGVEQFVATEAQGNSLGRHGMITRVTTVQLDDFSMEAP